MWLMPFELRNALKRKFTTPVARLPPCGSAVSATLVLAAIHRRDRRAFQGNACGLAARLDHEPQLLGANQRFTDISVFRVHVEGDQPVAVMAVGLEAVAHFLRALAENLRAFRALDSDFLVDHESPFRQRCRRMLRPRP